MPSIVISAYSTEWPDLFCGIRDELLLVFAPTMVAVEHIGSTSVPGLVAKPVIDVLLGARSLAEIEMKIDSLGANGYEYVPRYERELPMRRYFVKAAGTSLRVHVHGVALGSRIWREHLAFRDALREDAQLRAQYQSLKLKLAEEFAEDKAAYSLAKGPFIQSVIAGELARRDAG
jgi:GrpB-like predicted nucleotidyltransferase (UPF0157 family)